MMKYLFKTIKNPTELVSTRELAVAVNDFFFEELRGLASVTIKDVSEKKVEVSIECLAKFFKILMESINGRFLAEIIIMQSEYDLIFLIKNPQKFDFGNKVLFELVDLAKKSDLSLSIEKDRLVLYAKLVDPPLKALNVYAISFHTIKDKFKSAFYNT